MTTINLRIALNVRIDLPHPQTFQRREETERTPNASLHDRPAYRQMLRPPARILMPFQRGINAAAAQPEAPAPL